MAWFVIAFAAMAIVAGAVVTAELGGPNDETITSNETEFDWGTVTTERTDETGAIAVEVTVESDAGAEVVAASVPNATERASDIQGDAAVEPFEWGVVRHAIDSETDSVEVTVLVDAADDVSLSVTTVGKTATKSRSSTVVSTGCVSGSDGEDGAGGEPGADGESGAAGAAGNATANVTVGQSTSESSIQGSAGTIDVDTDWAEIAVDDDE